MPDRGVPLALVTWAFGLQIRNQTIQASCQPLPRSTRILAPQGCWRCLFSILSAPSKARAMAEVICKVFHLKVLGSSSIPGEQGSLGNTRIPHCLPTLFSGQSPEQPWGSSHSGLAWHPQSTLPPSSWELQAFTPWGGPASPSLSCSESRQSGRLFMPWGLWETIPKARRA